MAWKSKSAITTEINTLYADNTVGAIEPVDLRTVDGDQVDSFQQAPIVNLQSGASYTFVVDDYGKLVIFNNNAGAVAVTLPQAIGPFALWNVLVRNVGAGTVTITPIASQIGGAANLTLVTGQTQGIISDGANYQITQSRNVLASGDTMSGNLTISAAGIPQFLVNSTNMANQAAITWQQSGNNRWSAQTDTVAETGGSTGKDFNLFRFTDAALAVNVLNISRATGVATFAATPVIPLTAPTLDTQVANKKYVDDKTGGGGVFAQLPVTNANLAAFTNSTGNQIKAVTVQSPLSYDPVTGVLTSAAGGGNVSSVGSPTNGLWAQWTTSTTIQGVAASATPFVLLAGSTMTGTLLNTAGVALVLGNTTNVTGAREQIIGNVDLGCQLDFLRYSNDASPSIIRFHKSRNPTPGQNTALQVGDTIGRLDFGGVDSANTGSFVGARIEGIVTNAPTSGVIPTRLSFYTSSALGLLETLRIWPQGTVAIGSTAIALGNLVSTNAGLLTLSRIYMKQDVDSNAAGLAIVNSGSPALMYTYIYQSQGPLRFEGNGVNSGFLFFGAGDITTPLLNLTPTDGAHIKGTTVGGTATTGCIGEMQAASTSSVTVPNGGSGTVVVTTPTLSAGDWDIWVEVDCVVAGTQFTFYYANIVLSGGTAVWDILSYGITKTVQSQIRRLLASPTAITATLTITTSGGSASAGGRIYARRVR